MLFDQDKIQEAKRSLGTKAAHIIADDLKIEDWNPEKLKGKSIFKRELTASMSWYSEAHTFKCFATGKTYDIVDHFMWKYNLTFFDAVNKLFEEASKSDKDFKYEKWSPKAINEKKKSKSERMIGYKYPEEEPFNDRKIVEHYLGLRGIDSKTMDFCNVMQGAKGEIAFQFMDIDGSHLGTKYRISHPHNNKKELKWFWQSKRNDGESVSHCPIPYGMNRLDLTSPVIIVEGLVDRLSCVQAGFSNTIAVPNGANSFEWIDHSWELFEEVEQFIIFPDGDEPGLKMAKDVATRLGEAKCSIVKVDQDTQDRVSKYFKGVITKADPNSVLMACGEDTIRRLIKDAEPIPNEKLSFLMRVDDIEIEDMEKISTGFRALDEILYGNLMGCFTIVSGEPNSGKSVFANQLCILSPMEQGYKPMIFSGELGSPQLLNWVLKPLAGLNHIRRWQKDGSPVGYSITKQAKKRIKEYYDDKIIYFSDKDTLSASGDDIIKEMTYAHKRYNIRVFLLDNLMTINTNEDDGDDRFQSQTKFIKKLLAFTNKYNVFTVLVAHPKKPGKGETPGIYSVSGASELANLSHRMIWITRLDNDPEGFNTEVKIIKDRPTGMANKKCKLYYDKRTMRLYSSPSEQSFMYRWERESNIKYDQDTMKSIVANVNEDGAEVFGALPE